MRFSWLLGSLIAVGRAQANVKAVFAHFMVGHCVINLLLRSQCIQLTFHDWVGNTGSYTVADWQDDISKAAAAHIDGFALNMAVGETTNGASLQNAFTAANNLGSTFKLFFSLDYAGNGLWDKADVISLINRYSSNPAYYHRGSSRLSVHLKVP